MRAGAMSAVLYGLGQESYVSGHTSVDRAEARIVRPTQFCAERFANEQIRGLVRQVFTIALVPPVRQVVFSGMEAGFDVDGICRKVGETLASETAKEVVVVTSIPGGRSCREMEPIRTAARCVHNNLWSLQLPDNGSQITADSLPGCMGEIRREFEYSIVAASAGEPQEALAMGQAADGVVLVVSAMRTRRAGAIRFREMLTKLRLLGTVLTDREFPIPEAIYRKL